MIEGLDAVLSFAQTDFSMSRIDQAVVDALRDKINRAQRDLAQADLRLSTHNIRYHELTGFPLQAGFDLKSAWLLTDVDTAVLQVPALAPVTLFEEVDWVVVLGSGALSVETLANKARIELMDLHEAVSAYAAADKQVEEYEPLSRRGEINRYQFHDVVYERLVARVAVHERKQAYAQAMLELDRSLGGLVSSRHRNEPAQWFFQPGWVFEGRESISYDWAENAGGLWRASRLPGVGGQIALEILHLRENGMHISRASVYYDGEMLTEGRIDSALNFHPPTFEGNSLIEVVFSSADGTQISNAYIDGFTDVGRFFDIIPPPDTESEIEDSMEEEIEAEIEIETEIEAVPEDDEEGEQHGQQ